MLATRSGPRLQRLVTAGGRLTRAHLLAVPFAVARVQASVIDRHLVQRLSMFSRTRIACDYVYGSADRWAGTVLHDHDIEAAGRARVEDSVEHSPAGRRAAVADPGRAARN